jgi:fermentation-respiration switch protein FrsA (DUF1100 family)
MIWLIHYRYHLFFVIGSIFLALVILTERVVTWKVYEITHPPRILGSGVFRVNNRPLTPINLKTSDGLQLAGWYLPPRNGATIILQHGYHTNSEEMLPIAEMLERHGYGLLLFDFRAHGRSEGETVTFGLHEVKDTQAALTFLRNQPEVHPDKIGLLGVSMGGAVGILASAKLEGIRAVAVEGVFAKLEDEVSIGIQAQTPLPAIPFASIFMFFAEQGHDYKISGIAPVEKIDQISPRPILILQGGADERIPANSGQRLFAAAGEPKEYWYEPKIAHAKFSTSVPLKYEKRIVAFFDQYLLKGVQTDF